MIPLRSVYVVPENGLIHRCSVAFRDCLRSEENSDLKLEYGNLKWQLAQRKDFRTMLEYSDSKTEVVRKVLKRAGVTDEDIAEKEASRVDNWPEELII